MRKLSDIVPEQYGFNFPTLWFFIFGFSFVGFILSLWAGADGRVCGAKNNEPFTLYTAHYRLAGWVGCFGRGISTQFGSPLESDGKGNIIKNP